jgi:voltage-gated potassium channel
VSSVRLRFLADLIGRLWKILAVLVALWVGAAVGFYFLNGGVTPLLAFYWAIVTLSTVGYGDIVPHNSFAVEFTILVIALQLFLVVYILGLVGTAINEEAQKRFLGTLGTSLRAHIVVLGYSAVGRAAVRELLAEHQKVAVVTEHQEDIANLRALVSEDRLFVTYGPPGEKEILRRANVTAAHSVVVCTDDDTVNLIASLNVRVLAPHVRLVVSVHRPELQETLLAAGVTYVASPGDMAGRLCSSAAFQPEVANVVDDLTSAAFGVEMHEYVLTDRTPVSTDTLPEAEAKVRAASDCLIIGYARPNEAGVWTTTLNPPKTTRLSPGDALVVLGTAQNLERFRTWIGVDTGR